MRVIKAYICKGKNYVFAVCRGFKASNWVRKSQIRKLLKVYGPQIANPQSATFAEGPQI